MQTALCYQNDNLNCIIEKLSGVVAIRKPGYTKLFVAEMGSAASAFRVDRNTKHQRAYPHETK